MLHTARLSIIYLLVSILLLMFMPIPGSSSDVKGNYVAAVLFSTWDNDTGILLGKDPMARPSRRPVQSTRACRFCGEMLQTPFPTVFSLVGLRDTVWLLHLRLSPGAGGLQHCRESLQRASPSH
jgi:hypothetical protein